jgi:ferredoxin-NADP reductase
MSTTTTINGLTQEPTDLVNRLARIFTFAGPKGMIDWVRKTAAGEGWPRESIHCEEFCAAIRASCRSQTAVSNIVIQVEQKLARSD